MIYDYILVGQGISGTILSHRLISKGKSVLIFDNNHLHSSTKIAAGIINPITGRKFVKSWIIDDLIPEAIKCYKELETDLNIKLVHQANIVRVIFNAESQRYWERIILNDSAERYISKNPDLSSYKNILHPIYDFGEVQNSYRIDVASLVKKFQEEWMQSGILINEQFDFNHLTFNESEIIYKSHKAEKIIFCEGYRSIYNPLFNYLPFQPVKGEAIKFSIDNFEANKMLRHKHFIVPLSEGIFWSGGGYQWDVIDETPSPSFLKNWKSDMNKILQVEPIIHTHQAAVRPAVKGRRPLLGNHPIYKNAYIFNGMGTKGASLVPYWSKHFVNHLLKNNNIDKQVDIKRF